MRTYDYYLDTENMEKLKIKNSTYIYNHHFKVFQDRSKLSHPNKVVAQIEKSTQKFSLLVDSKEKDYEKLLDTKKEVDLLWLILNKSETSHNDKESQTHYKLYENDYIKLGKVKFKVYKIHIKHKTIKESKQILGKLDPSINHDISHISHSNSNNNFLDKNISPMQELNSIINYKTNSVAIYDQLEKDTIDREFINIKKRPLKDKSITLCRVCLSEDEKDNPLINPCKCSGSVRFIHQECLKTWLFSNSTIKKSKNIVILTLKLVRCEICHDVFPEKGIVNGKVVSFVGFDKCFDGVNLAEKNYIILQNLEYNKENSKSKVWLIAYMKDSRPFMLLGRVSGADVQVICSSVSRQQSIIKFYNEGFYIEDLKSRNGTSVLLKSNIEFIPYHSLAIQSFYIFLIFSMRKTCCSFIYAQPDMGEYYENYNQNIEVNHIIDDEEKELKVIPSYKHIQRAEEAAEELENTKNFKKTELLTLNTQKLNDTISPAPDFKIRNSNRIFKENRDQ